MLSSAQLSPGSKGRTYSIGMQPDSEHQASPRACGMLCWGWLLPCHHPAAQDQPSITVLMQDMGLTASPWGLEVELLPWGWGHC